MRAYVYKLCPTKTQAKRLEEVLEICRNLYNDALAERKAVWGSERRVITYRMQSASLPKQKQNNAMMMSVHSQVLQNTLFDSCLINDSH